MDFYDGDSETGLTVFSVVGLITTIICLCGAGLGITILGAVFGLW